MKHEESVMLEVTDWPRFQRQTAFAFDARLFPSEDALRVYARGRFGEGILQKTGDREWRYVRRIAGPKWFWGALARVLNKSYV